MVGGGLSLVVGLLYYVGEFLFYFNILVLIDFICLDVFFFGLFYLMLMKFDNYYYYLN